MRVGFTTVALLVVLQAISCKQVDYLYPLKNSLQPLIHQTVQLETAQFNDKVDILWVVDNSPSMQDKQAVVASNIDVFISKFVEKNNLSWKMGMISTDVWEQPYIGFKTGTELTYQTPNAVEKFQQAVSRLGTMGDAEEKAFDPIMRAITTYPDFLRPHAVLGLIIVSDEDEQSKTYPTEVFMEAMKKIKGSWENIFVYLIVAGAEDCGPLPVDPNDCPMCFRGSQYERFMKLSNAKRFIICSNFAKEMPNIALDLVKKTRNLTFRLKNQPIVSTIQVSYLGKILTGGTEKNGGVWVYDPSRNAIYFHHTDFLIPNTLEPHVDIQYVSAAI